MKELGQVEGVRIRAKEVAWGQGHIRQTDGYPEFQYLEGTWFEKNPSSCKQAPSPHVDSGQVRSKIQDSHISDVSRVKREHWSLEPLSSGCPWNIIGIGLSLELWWVSFLPLAGRRG